MTLADEDTYSKIVDVADVENNADGSIWQYSNSNSRQLNNSLETSFSQLGNRFELFITALSELVNSLLYVFV